MKSEDEIARILASIAVTEKARVLPDEFVKHRYPTPVHGIGMTDE